MTHPISSPYSLYTRPTDARLLRRLLDYRPDPIRAARMLAGTKRGHVTPPTTDELELELTHSAHLLELTGGAELDAFAARLVAEAGPDGPAALCTPHGQLLRDALAQYARSVRPSGIADLKRKAAAIFGMELEGLSPEDKEFEYARHLVRFLRDVAATALQPPSSGTAMNGGQRVQAALAQAARRHAPGLLRYAVLP